MGFVYEEKKKRDYPVDEGKVDNAYSSMTNDYDTYSQSLSPYETSLEKKKDVRYIDN